MTPEQIDRVFGCGRLQMVTGEHVEVFREAAVAGTQRRYTKRFLHTLEADFGQWTEREWRILARLIGHGIACVPDVVQYDRGGPGGAQLVQTYDAGVTVDQWATLLPVTRTLGRSGASSVVMNHGPSTIAKSRSFGGTSAVARSRATGDTATTVSRPTRPASPASIAIPEPEGGVIRAPGPATAAGFANSNEPCASKTLTEGGVGSGTSSSTPASG